MRRLLLVLLLASPALAADPPRPGQNGISGLPTPRFVSVAKDKAYLRTGPGAQYPIAWVYTRKGLPLEILREYDSWRQVRDEAGTVGWMDRVMLTGARTALVSKAERLLYATADLQSRPLWRIAPGAQVEVTLCDQAWCRVTADGRSGYILRSQLWGVYPNEVIE